MQWFLEANPTGNATERFDTTRYVWYLLPTAMAVPALGLPANALVIRLLLGKPGICSTSEIFTLHLAILDMLFCAVIFVEYIYFLFERTEYAASFLAWGLNQGGGPLLLCLLSVDSYLAVCHPLLFLRLKDPKLRISMCLVVNAVAAIICVLVKRSGRYKWKLVLALMSGVIAVISACNVLILRSLRQVGPSGKEVHPVKKRAFKIVLSAYVLVNLHYLPPVAEYLLRMLGPRHLRPFSALTCATFFFLSMSSFLQPLSYLVRTKQLPGVRCHRCSAGGT